MFSHLHSSSNKSNKGRDVEDPSEEKAETDVFVSFHSRTFISILRGCPIPPPAPSTATFDILKAVAEIILFGCLLLDSARCVLLLTVSECNVPERSLVAVSDRAADF
jgi:hypothetical protein